MRQRVKPEADLKVTVKDIDETEKVHPAQLPKAPGLSALKYTTILLLAIAVKSWQPIAVGMSKLPNGTFSYNKSTMVLLVEFFKLVFCVIAFSVQFFSTDPIDRPGLYSLPFRQSLHFVIPSILYAAANTLVYVGIAFINPALFHVYGNIRIMTAAVLYRIIMKKPQSDLQWVAMVLLTSGAVLASPLDSLPTQSGENNFLGLIANILMCVCSSCSSIYTEINYKKTQHLSIFYQNIVLYLYGIAVNGIWIIVNDFERLQSEGIFYGFDSKAVHVLVSQAAMGVSLSFIFKYLDNIVYVITFTVSMFISAMISVLLFDFVFSIQFTCALVIVTTAIYIYYREKVLEKYGVAHHEAMF